MWKHLYNSGIFFNWEGKTSGIKNLLFSELALTLNSAIPDHETLTMFHNVLKSLDASKQNNLLQTQELTALRDWLLPMLMNGQVAVG